MASLRENYVCQDKIKMKLKRKVTQRDYILSPWGGTFFEVTILKNAISKNLCREF